MISVLLYGRNDPHGYNLHKRAVISMNAIAAMLTHEDDEIIFIDYNTPDDIPTFIEAIADTLTEECRKMLRVIRVRPELHQKYYAHRTGLNALEPISRNIGLRRTNPKNKWILSTNTDMVFSSRIEGKSLSDLCVDLPKKLYEIPRFEVPESLWEAMDRKDSKALIKDMYEYGHDLHLEEIVGCYREAVYDGPGDFQLMPRDDLFAINGFDEEMILGWHCDSNLCRRFYLIYGETGILTDKLFGYHCDHTRTASISHKPTSTQNSWRRFIRNVFRPDIPEQAENWGHPNVDFEEFRPHESPTEMYASVLKGILKHSEPVVFEQGYTNKTWDKVYRKATHVLPYLATLIAPLHKKLVCGYCGNDPEMFALFAELWKRFGFTGKIVLFKPEQSMQSLLEVGRKTLGYTPALLDWHEIDTQSELLIFDVGNMGLLEDYKSVMQAKIWKNVVATQIASLAQKEIRDIRQGNHRMRKYVIINGVGTEPERLADKYLAATKTPFGTHIRHGYVVPPLTQQAAI